MQQSRNNWREDYKTGNKEKSKSKHTVVEEEETITKAATIRARIIILKIKSMKPSSLKSPM
jgi:hypothetical protein